MTPQPLSKPVPTVVGCGLVALDVVLRTDHAVEYAGVGGTVGNVMSIMAFLGWRSLPLVRLGADPAGVRILQELVSLGVDISQLSFDKRLSTPIVYQRNVGYGGPHTFSFRCPHCGTARRFNQTLLEGVGAQASHPLTTRGDVFFFDRLTASTVELAEQAKANGALVVFEPSSAGDNSARFERALRTSHVVKYSAERLADAVMPELSAGFVEIQTLGASGLRFRMRSLDPSWVSLPAIAAANVVDTAGAGDWCTAGFIHMVGRGLEGGTLSDLGYNEIYQSLRAGQVFAAMNCQHIGARGLMRRIGSLQLLEGLKTFLERRSTDPRWVLEPWEIDQLFHAGVALDGSTHGAVQSMPPLCCDTFSGPSAGAELFH